MIGTTFARYRLATRADVADDDIGTAPQVEPEDVYSG